MSLPVLRRSTEIDIPRLNDSAQDARRIARIVDTARGHKAVTLKFHRCDFLRPMAVSSLGALQAECLDQKKVFEIDRKSICGPVLENLLQKGFLPSDTSVRSSNGIPLRIFAPDCDVDRDLPDYLRSNWAERIPGLERHTANDVIMGIMEVVDNAWLHSRFAPGVSMCGQYFPGKGELQLSMVDLGSGIPDRVRNCSVAHLGPNADDTACLRWATADGHSTREDLDSFDGRGAGFTKLRKLVDRFNGSLKVFSGGGYLTRNQRSEQTYRLDVNFPGTAVNISVNY